MKTSLFAAALIGAVIASPASAQSVADDTRCFVLSNFYAKAHKEEQGRRLAGQAQIFFLGRLDARASATAIAAEFRAQAATADPKTAGAQMGACAARVTRAQQALQAATNTGTPPAK